MREAIRTLRLMVTISLRADAVRSAAAVVTAVGQQVAIPVRALGLMVLADGIVEQELRSALLGVLLIAGLTGLHRLMAWASLTVRMRLRENTQLYLDTYLMDLTAGVPGIAHHELPEYLDRVELLRNERHYLANPFNPISWTSPRSSRRSASSRCWPASTRSSRCCRSQASSPWSPARGRSTPSSP